MDDAEEFVEDLSGNRWPVFPLGLREYAKFAEQFRPLQDIPNEALAMEHVLYLIRLATRKGEREILRDLSLSQFQKAIRATLRNHLNHFVPKSERPADLL